MSFSQNKTMFIYYFRCANGYMGPRCEYKDLDGSYLREFPLLFFFTFYTLFNNIIFHQQQQDLELCWRQLV